MKDRAHHIQHVQKKIIQEARQEAKEKKERTMSKEEAEERKTEQTAVMDLDNRRKGLTEYVRPRGLRS